MGLASDRARYHAWKQYFAWREDLRRRWAASEVARTSTSRAGALREALSAGRPGPARQELRHLRHRLGPSGDLEAIEDERDAEQRRSAMPRHGASTFAIRATASEWELTSIAYARHAARAFPVVASRARLCAPCTNRQRRTPRARPLAGPTRRT